MPKKKTTTKKPKKKTTKAVTVRKPKQDLIFAGAEPFAMRSTKMDEERQLISMTAEVFKVSPMAINILGNFPYLNKLGRKQKIRDYDKNAKIEINWVQNSLTDTDKAVCEARITKGGRPLTPFIRGECSPASTKMSTLKGYQNHIAETRAINRVIEFQYGVRIHEEMMAEIAKKLQKGGDRKILEKAAQANIVSAEEISTPESKKRPSAPILPEEPTAKSDPVRMAAEYIKRVKDKQTLMTCARKIKENPEFSDSNKAFLQNLINTQDKKIKK